MAKRALEFESASHILAIPRLAQAALAAAADSFDTDTTLLACSTGIYAGNGKWTSHDAALRYTQCVDVKYDPEAKCPEWDRYIESSIPDADQRRYLQVMIGFALVGGNRRKKRVVNLIGPKDTGKSTFVRVLHSVLGPYLATPAVEELVAGSGRARSDKFALNELRGSRMAAMSETAPGSRFRMDVIKALVGGDMISTQGKGTRPVTWQASVMLFIATNNQIQFDVKDKAFSDRLVPIEFRRSRTIDRHLDEKLAAERTGIFNWFLAGVDNALSDRLEEPKAIRASRRRAENAASTAYEFLEAALERGKLVEVKSSHPVIRCCKITPLYELYRSWAKRPSVGIRPMRQREFTAVVDQRYPQTEKNAGDGVKHHLGIAFAKDAHRS